jgi:hypothetical protein
MSDLPRQDGHFT